jgi:hypothetical protein
VRADEGGEFKRIADEETGVLLPTANKNLTYE